MATYRLEAKIIGRSQGRSATASAAYRAAERIDDARTGVVFDYSRKRGVLHAEILAPPDTPAWMQDRAQLWNAVEQAEKRKDAQLARDLVLSLPHELTDDQRLTLVREFVRGEFVSQGMIADLSVHAPDRQGDARNHHAHVMLTMRELTGDGFGKKVRAWNDTDRLEQWREQWATTVNSHLERHGHAARVDHRSLADQGVDREPEPKQGPIATEMEREGRLSHAGDDRRAAQARNDARAEIAAELATVTADIIDLAKERAQRAEPEPASHAGQTLDSTRGQPQPEPPSTAANVAAPLQRDSEAPQAAPAEEDRSDKPDKPATTTSDGGMVAQQREALRRFVKNSAALEEQRQASPVKEATDPAQAEKAARYQAWADAIERRQAERAEPDRGDKPGDRSR